MTMRHVCCVTCIVLGYCFCYSQLDSSTTVSLNLSFCSLTIPWDVHRRLSDPLGACQRVSRRVGLGRVRFNGTEVTAARVTDKVWKRVKLMERMHVLVSGIKHVYYYALLNCEKFPEKKRAKKGYCSTLAPFFTTYLSRPKKLL